MLENMERHMVTHIYSGRIPEYWDGIELRAWLKHVAGTFAPDRSRYRARLAAFERHLLDTNI